MKLYVAGPMRGYPELNHPAFHRTAAVLRELGHDAVNPAEKDELSEGLCTPGEIMRWDLEQVLACDGIVLLPGWELSQGAKLERLVAESTGRRVFCLVADPLGLEAGVLAEAPPWHHELIFGRDSRFAPRMPMMTSCD